MKLSDLAKVATEAATQGPIYGGVPRIHHYERIALAVAKAVLAEAAKRIEGSRLDQYAMHAGTVRSLATELERESDVR